MNEDFDSLPLSRNPNAILFDYNEDGQLTDATIETLCGALNVDSFIKSLVRLAQDTIDEEQKIEREQKEQRAIIETKADQVWCIQIEKAILKKLRTMPYQAYLRTNHWQGLRKRKLAQAHYRCEVCNRGNCELNVHHRTYARRGQELDEDLTVLCRKCHSLFHENSTLIP